MRLAYMMSYSHSPLTTHRFTFSIDDDPAFLRGALLSHASGRLALVALGAMRSLNAPLMLLLVDQLAPLLGARSTVGAKHIRPLQRCKERPPVMSCQKWHQASCRANWRRSQITLGSLVYII